jgi:hypothetical protein
MSRISLHAILATVIIFAPVAAQDEAAIRPPANALEILSRYNIGPEQFARFVVGQPLTSGEEELLARILDRLPRIGLDSVVRFRRKDVGWEELASTAESFRGEYFALRGRAKLVERHLLPPELAERLEFSSYFRVMIELDGSSRTALVCTRTVPQAWQIDKPIDERAAADGMFLKYGTQSGQERQLFFAATRVAWLPDRLDAERQIGQDQIHLAQRGFDWSLLDQVRGANGRGLGDGDREAFYQLLAAVGRANLGELRSARTESELIPSLAQPQEIQGDIFAIQGSVRCITKVAVDDPSIRERLGIDHYFQLDLLLPLGNQKVRIGEGAGRAPAPVLENSFPATLIVRRLPSGLKEGEDLHEFVQADAVFFKLWSYRSKSMEQFDRLQPAPLLVADLPHLFRPPPPQGWPLGSAVAGALALGLVIAMILWCWPTARRRFRQQTTSPDFSTVR